jgi:tetratricopeptide (TPR) repeat protein
MGLSAGTRLGPYEILGPLGEGGMGAVYRARDVRLDRIVAVKVLSDKFAADPEALARFEREAKAVAALSHPNILSLHDVGVDGGVSYAVMELLEGETLRERLRGGPLAPGRAIGWGVQIAEGLAAAHEKGLVHRDLKPENLFVTRGGRIKILDFGVAKRTTTESVRGDAPTDLLPTEPGVLIGTASYMSPEQVRGRPVDPRSDIFSFGVVLYEMLAGSRPFQGRSPADAMVAILTEQAPPLADRVKDLPPPLERIVERCLAKEPEERYHSAQDLAADLGALADRRSGGESLPTIVTGAARPEATRPMRLALYAALPLLLVAVGVLVWLGRPRAALSFAPRDWILVADVKNGTGEPVFDRSLFTALTVSLEQSTHANVFPRSRVASALNRMKRSPSSPIDAELGREICLRENVRALVTCEIERAASRYTLAARIVDPRTGESVRSFEEQARGEDAVLPALSALAVRIRENLGESLPAIQRSNRPLPMVTTASLKALQQFTEGQELWARGKYVEAVKMFEMAVQEDPGFAMAHAALGNAWTSHLYNQPSKGLAAYAKALELASRTTDRERLVIQASSSAASGDWAESARLYKAYLETYPDDVSTRYALGTLLMQNRRPVEALEQFQHIVRVAPASPSAFINMATTLDQLHRFPEALDAYAKAFALEPAWETGGNLNHEYGFTFVRAGQPAKAREVFAKAVAVPDYRARGLRSLAVLDLYEGHYHAAGERFREAALMNEAARNRLSASRDRMFLASVFEGEGDAAGQLAELERARAALEGLDVETLWPSRLGVAFARAGAIARAEGLRAAVAKRVRPASASDASELHRLEGEIELAHGRHAAAVEKLRLADREFQTGLTLESLAFAAWKAGSLPEAVSTYEALLATSPAGWEAQQGWVTAPYFLALAYRASGQVDKARAAADRLLAQWKDADSDLVVLRRTRELSRELAR